MGSGCLSPKMPEGPIDIFLLDSIYNQSAAYQVSVEMGESYAFEYCYDSFKEYLIKKGTIKKLVDYLLFHKHRITSNIFHCCQLTNKDSEIKHKMATIIFLNLLFSKIQSIKTNEGLMATQHTDRNAENSISSKNETLTAAFNQIATLFLSAPIQHSYFKIVSSMMNSSPQLYLNALQSARLFSQFSRYTLNQSPHLEEFLQQICYSIQVYESLNISLQVSLNILRRLPKSYFDKNMKNIRLFLKLYLEKSEKEEDCEVTYLSFEILRLFFMNCSQQAQQQQVFRIFLVQMDKNNFFQIQHLERCFIRSVNQNQLKQRLVRGFLLAFFAYLSYPKDQKLRTKWSFVHYFENPDAFKHSFINIFDIETKLYSLQKIIQWIFKYQLVKAQEILSYHNQKLFSVYLLNLMSENKDIRIKCELQISNFCKHLTKQDKIYFVYLLISELRYNSLKIQYSADCFLSILRICQEYLRKIHSLELQSDYQALFYSLAELPAYLTLQVKLQICRFMKELLLKIGNKQIQRYYKDICEFFLSISRQLDVPKSSLQLSSSERLLDQYRTLLQGISSQRYSGILFASTQQIINFVSQNQIKKSQKRIKKQIDSLICLNLQKINIISSKPRQIEKIDALEGERECTEWVEMRLGVCKMIRQEMQGLDVYELAKDYMNRLEKEEQMEEIDHFLPQKSLMSGISFQQQQEQRILEDILDIIRI